MVSQGPFPGEDETGYPRKDQQRGEPRVETVRPEDPFESGRLAGEDHPSRDVSGDQPPMSFLEPGADEDDDRFDAGDDGVDPKSNLPAVLIGIGLGILVLGGIAWFALSGSGDDLAFDEDRLERVTAGTDPYREAPRLRSGMQIDNQDRAIYGRIGETDAPDPVDGTAVSEPEAPEPPPASPTGPGNFGPSSVLSGRVPSVTRSVEPPPVAPPSALRDEPSATTTTPSAAPRAPVLADVPAPPAPPPVASAAPSRETSSSGSLTAPPSAYTRPASPAGDSSAASPETRSSAASPETRSSAASPAGGPAVTAAPSRSSAAPSVATGGSSMVQVLSVRSADVAEAEWKRLEARHRDLLGGLSHQVVRADLGERGIYYRVRVTGLKDNASAKALCDELTKRSQGCIVVR